MSKVAVMNTKQLEFGGQTLTLRLDAKTMVRIEQKLKRSLIALFIEGEGIRMPMIGELLTVIHEANFTPNIKAEDMLDLYDKHIRSGKSYMDLFEKVSEILTEAGYLPKKEAEEVPEEEVSLVPETEEIVIEETETLV